MKKPGHEDRRPLLNVPPTLWVLARNSKFHEMEKATDEYFEMQVELECELAEIYELDVTDNDDFDQVIRTTEAIWLALRKVHGLD